MKISEKAKKIVRRILRITLTTVLVILGIILLILVLIQTGPVQDYGRGKIEAYLEKKLQTKVRIGNLYIDFPARIIIKNIYLEDRSRDTLISGGRIEVDISMFRLFHKEIRINNLELDNVTLKVKRLMPDSFFNFQFIPDAFSTTAPQPVKKDTGAGFQFIIGDIRLHQIHATYHDDATGNDMYVSLGDFKTKLKTFDPAHQDYAIPDISLSDISGSIRQYNPILLLKHAADTISERNKNSEPVHLALGDIDFTRINLDYRNDAQNMDAVIRLGNFHTRADSIDLATLHIKLKQVSLNRTVATVKFDRLSAIKNKKEVPVKDTIAHTGLWSVDLAAFTIDSTRLQYDDDNKAAIKKGMDYNHMNINHLSIHSSGLHADPSSYRAVISGISFDEKSGFVLKKLSAGLDYDTTGISLKNLVIQTNRSEIKNQTSIQYRSLNDMKKHPGDIKTNLEFDHARIAVKDVLIFVPSLEALLKDNQNAVLNFNGKVTGQLKKLQIPYLEIGGVGNTSLAASGTINGLPDAKKAFYDISLSKFKTSRTDLFRLIPEKSFPENLRIPESISANGKFRGTVNSFFVQLHTETNNGMADVHGTLDLNHKTYDLIADTRSLDLGYILKQDSLIGKITLNATAKGSGFDPKKMNSIFHVNLGEGEIKSYTYKGLLLDASLQNGNGKIQSSMKDPNLTYHLNAESAFAEKFPSLKLKLQLDTLNAQALHLMDSLQLHLIVDADFKSTNPDALQGHMELSDLGITTGSQSLHTDSVLLLAQHTDTGQLIQLHSEAADIDWAGQYKLTQVTASFKHFINNYYQIKVSMPDSTEPEQWQMALRFRPSPIVLVAIPSLKGTDSLTGNIRYNSMKKNLNVLLHADKIQINQQVVHQFNLTADSKDSALLYNISVADVGQKGFQLYRSSVYGALAHNKLSTTLLLKDKKAKNKYFLSGALSQVSHGVKFIFNPDSLILDYQPWQMPSDNFIFYDSSGLIVRNFKLSRQDESITINSKDETTKSPLEVSFTDFKIKTLTQFAEQDSLLADGTIDGKAEVKNIFSKPLFTSDLTIDSLSIEKDTLGNLTIRVDNEQLNAYAAHIALKGHDNDVLVDGKYHSLTWNHLKVLLHHRLKQ
jgi:translocation and assembly module TamB